MIPRGEPIVQVIPFKRGFSKKAEIRAMNQKGTKQAGSDTAQAQ